MSNVVEGEIGGGQRDLEDQARCARLCRDYLQNAQVEFREKVDKAKADMRELWNKRAPPAKDKKGKGKKK